MRRRADAGPFALGICLLAGLTVTLRADAPRVRRGDAKAYRFLNDAKRQAPLNRGEAERTMALVRWRPLPRAADDPAREEPEARRQILDATCDADLVVIAKAASAVPFRHPNDRWVLTAHDLEVSRVIRTLVPKEGRLERVRYVHPSGETTIAGRAISTTVDRLPRLATDEEALFFLVRIDGDTFRTSLLLPPMAIRSGTLDPFGPARPATTPEAAVGYSVRDAARAAADAVCRPPAVERNRRPGTSDGRLPPLTPRLGPP